MKKPARKIVSGAATNRVKLGEAMSALAKAVKVAKDQNNLVQSYREIIKQYEKLVFAMQKQPTSGESDKPAVEQDTNGHNLSFKTRGANVLCRRDRNNN